MKTDSTGRKMVTKETQEGCLSISIKSFQLVENLPRAPKSVFGALGRVDPFPSGNEVRPMSVLETIALLTLVTAAIQLGFNLKR